MNCGRMGTWVEEKIMGNDPQDYMILKASIQDTVNEDLLFT